MSRTSVKTPVALCSIASLLTVLVCWHLSVQDSRTDLTRPDLTGLTVAELMAQKLTPAVGNELLRRDDVPIETMNNALIVVAKHSRSSTATVLLQLVRQLPEDTSDLRLSKLTGLFTDTAAPYALWRSEWNQLRHHQNTSIRRTATAVVVTAEKDTDRIWHQMKTKERLPELVTSLELISHAPLRNRLYEDLQHRLRHKTLTTETQRQAILSSASLAPDSETAAHDLIVLLRERRQTDACLQAIHQLPDTAWPNDQLGHLAAGVIACLAETTPDQDKSHVRQLAQELAVRLVPRLPTADRKRFQQRVNELTR